MKLYNTIYVISAVFCWGFHEAAAASKVQYPFAMAVRKKARRTVAAQVCLKGLCVWRGKIQ